MLGIVLIILRPYSTFFGVYCRVCRVSVLGRVRMVLGRCARFWVLGPLVGQASRAPKELPQFRPGSILGFP